jgi:hypothetical protein
LILLHIFSDNLFSITRQDKGKQRQISNFEPSQEDHGISTQDLGGSLYNLGMPYVLTMQDLFYVCNLFLAAPPQPAGAGQSKFPLTVPNTPQTFTQIISGTPSNQGRLSSTACCKFIYVYS